MKKVLISLFLVVSMFILFAAENTKDGSIGNSAGTNKLGGIIGIPVGLSFSHNFTKVDQIDLTVALFPGIVGGYYGRYFAGDIALGYLRSIFEPNINGVECPLEIGGGISFTSAYLNGFHPLMTIYFDLRWEIFFSSIPKFNMFLDFSPGIGFYLGKNSFIYYAPRGGLGLRAVL